MFPRLVVVLASVVLSLGGLSSCVAEPIDAHSASRWVAQPGWTPSRLAAGHRLEADGDWLKFSVVGQGKQMTWTLAPEGKELAGEPRYLLLAYRAEQLDAASKDLLLSATFGESGWVRLVGHDRLQADGQPHVLAVDMLSHVHPAPIERLMVRIAAGGDEGHLWAKLEWADELPAGVVALSAKAPKAESLALKAREITWSASANWSPRPPVRHSMQPTDVGTRFTMEGERRSMRWSGKLASPVDLRKLPYVSVRYRARGRFGPSGYVVYLSAADIAGKKVSAYAMQPGDVIGDGQWHVYTHPMSVREMAKGSIAVGIDSLAPNAEIEIDYIRFTSQPPLIPLADCVPFEQRSQPWPDGRDGLRTIPLTEARRANPYLTVRMALGEWFPTTEITMAGIPFRVPASIEKTPATGTTDEDSLAVAIPPEAKEILVLLLACFPNSEETTKSNSSRSLLMLDEPERAYFELRYEDGTVDRMLPVHAATGKYGIAHGVEVYGLRPSAGKRPVELTFCDRMRNACFGLAGVTANCGQTRVAEPEVPQVWYASSPAPAEAAAQPGTGWYGMARDSVADSARRQD